MVHVRRVGHCSVYSSSLSFVFFDCDLVEAIGADILGINRRLDVAVPAIGEAGNRCCHPMFERVCEAASLMYMKTA